MAEHATRSSGGGSRAVVGLLLVLLLAGLSGCSALGRSQAAATTTTQPDRVAIWREVIQCMRTHGMPNLPDPQFDRDRKSTRLNSSHVRISYAVFCLKKKNKK